MAFIAKPPRLEENDGASTKSNMSPHGQKASGAILRENECVGPRQGNNAAQLSKTVPMTGSTAEAFSFHKTLWVQAAPAGAADTTDHLTGGPGLGPS
jgi:hypothetical protein